MNLFSFTERNKKRLHLIGFLLEWELFPCNIFHLEKIKKEKKFHEVPFITLANFRIFYFIKFIKRDKYM